MLGCSWVVFVATKKKTPKSKAKVEIYEAKKRIKKGARDTDNWVRKHPWESVGIAALAGAVLGKLFFRRKR